VRHSRKTFYVYISKWQYGSRNLSQIPHPWTPQNTDGYVMKPQRLPSDVALASPEVLELLRYMAVRLMNPVVLRGDGVIQCNYHALCVVHVVEDQTVEIHTR